jgi:hypothetical protein
MSELNSIYPSFDPSLSQMIGYALVCCATPDCPAYNIEIEAPFAVNPDGSTQFACGMCCNPHTGATVTKQPGTTE